MKPFPTPPRILLAPPEKQAVKEITGLYKVWGCEH